MKMKVICKTTNREIVPGEAIALYTSHKIQGLKYWLPNGETGTFEEVTPNGLINFNSKGKSRQCLPEGIGAKIEYGLY